MAGHSKQFTILVSCMLLSMTCLGQVEWIQSTPETPWLTRQTDYSQPTGNAADIIVLTDQKEQVVEGFGACFNELGWTALSGLDAAARENVLKELYDPSTGLKLNICRVPIGANDYARNYYSLNDSAGDFEMKYFSIERDKQMLIPYIKTAMKYQPDLKVWGSPWTPPAWMKTNNHYACRPDAVNDLAPEKAGSEGITQFIMEPAYLKAYALYFVKFVQEYRGQGINLTGVHVQNEMNSCQNFPSCIWNATDLGRFIGSYLGPAFKSTVPGTELWYGTVERPSVEKIDTIMQHSEIAGYIHGVSFQWAGKQAIPGVHKKYPELRLMQSETECGDGSNDWKAAEYTFSLMKHYFDNGVCVYSFWNSVLDETGKSMWGWKQNSMITINSITREVTYNPEFYLLKHFSYFIHPGARKLKTSGNNNEVLAFQNPDKSIILIIENPGEAARPASFKIGGASLQIQLEPHSFNTFKIMD